MKYPLRETKRVAIYCRLSDEDLEKGDGDSESIENQRKILKKYACDQGWEIYKIYCDDGWSGFSRIRPEWLEMLEAAEKREFDIILCKSQARFTRDLELTEHYLHVQFPIWKIRFIGLADHVDTNIKGTRIQRQVNGLINEAYGEQSSQNVRIVFESKMRQGTAIGSYSIYGYKKDPDRKGHWIVDPEAAEIVRRIYDMCIAGMGFVAICKTLNAEGTPCPAKYKEIKYGVTLYTQRSRNAQDDLWSPITVRRILKDKRYLGHMIQGRRDKPSFKSDVTFPKPESEWITVLNTHEAIISDEIFNEVQLALSSRQRKRIDKTGRYHPLAGKIRCGECGASMERNCSPKKDGKVPIEYFRCSMVHRDPTICHGNNIRRYDLEDVVLNQLRKYLSCADEQDVAHKVSSKKILSEGERIQRELSNINREIGNKERYIEIAYDDRVSGILSKDQYVSFSAKFSREIEELRTRYNLLKKKYSEVEKNKSRDDELYAKISKYKNCEELTEELVGEFMELVEVYKLNEETGEREIHIHWKY